MHLVQKLHRYTNISLSFASKLSARLVSQALCGSIFQMASVCLDKPFNNEEAIRIHDSEDVNCTILHTIKIKTKRYTTYVLFRPSQLMLKNFVPAVSPSAHKPIPFFGSDLSLLADEIPVRIFRFFCKRTVDQAEATFTSFALFSTPSMSPPLAENLRRQKLSESFRIHCAWNCIPCSTSCTIHTRPRNRFVTMNTFVFARNSKVSFS